MSFLQVTCFSCAVLSRVELRIEPRDVLTPLQYHRHDNGFVMQSQMRTYAVSFAIAVAEDANAALANIQPALNQHVGRTGMQRLREIFSLPVSFAAPTKLDQTQGSASLPFVIAPLLGAITSPAFADNVMADLVNPVFSLLYKSCPAFIPSLVAALGDQAAAGTVLPTPPPVPSGSRVMSPIFLPPSEGGTLTWLDGLLPTALLMRHTLLKFPREAPLDPALQSAAGRLPELLDGWERCTPLGVAARPRIADLKRAVVMILRQVEVAMGQQRLAARQAESRSLEEQRERLFPNSIPAPAEPGALDGPGGLSRTGRPRHDNDHASIRDITIAPTADEVLCQLAPFLPPNAGPTSAHHLPAGTMSRLVDTHFRLLRHDMLAPIMSTAARFAAVVAEAGGLENGLERGRLIVGDRSDRSGVVAVPVFRHAAIADVAPGRGAGAAITFIVDFEPPPHVVAMTAARAAMYWDRAPVLQHGSLVCLWLQHPLAARQLLFASVTVRNAEGLALRRPRVGLTLCDAVYVPVLVELMLSGGAPGCVGPAVGEVVMLQACGSYFAYEPVLKALKTLDDAALPLGERLAGAGDNAGTMTPPAYSMTPGLRYNLSGLVAPGAQFDALRQQLQQTELRHGLALLKNQRPELNDDRPPPSHHEANMLDEAQLNALEAALTEEVALIQGPPGCGKTFVGVKLVKTLLDSFTDNDRLPMGALPIVLVCYTNHALDQLLEGLLDAGIAESDIVRVGARSKSDRLQNCALYDRVATGPRESGAAYASRKDREERLQRAAKDISEALTRLRKGNAGPAVGTPRQAWAAARTFLEVDLPLLAAALDAETGMDADGFQMVGLSGWDRWVHEAFATPRPQQPLGPKPPRRARRAARTAIVGGAFAGLEDLGRAAEEGDGAAAALPLGDDGPRWPPHLVAACESPWDLPPTERRAIIERITKRAIEQDRHRLTAAMAEHTRLSSSVASGRSASDLAKLKSARIVGMTTTGAAKNQALLGALGAQIVIVEEAAEVLEAHVLACLSPRTSHLILIGDHLQLRPKVENYELSADSRRGFNLDRSMFERLVHEGRFTVRTLRTQRRMHPSIADLIRPVVYFRLDDHPTVANWPPVRGFSKRLFFFDHDHPESGMEDGHASKVNKWEVKMAAAVAKYVLQQGYESRSVAVLVPYVGQLLELKKELAQERYMVISVSDRDTADLARAQGADFVPDEDASAAVGPPGAAPWPFGGVPVERDKAIRRLRLATIDNFQGEEADVCIVSLVRNNSQGKLGFLASPNRINVLLSRARHGMILLGSERTLTSSRAVAAPMWTSVFKTLRAHRAVGPGIELICHNHPENVTVVREPADFVERAVDGGCSRPCGSRLPCGHACTRFCHVDDPRHLASRCAQPCPRMRPVAECPLLHACPKSCGDVCGPCATPHPPVTLPCGHVADKLMCWQAQAPGAVKCAVPTVVHFAACGHSRSTACYLAAETAVAPERCTQPCDAVLNCGHRCGGRCGSCRSGHKACAAQCGRQLACGHPCPSRCHRNADGGRSVCPPCTLRCSSACIHSTCKRPCGEACAPCADACTWAACEHNLVACGMPCGAPCTRLPCDARCMRQLSCGHRCPSICGEVCPLTCLTCLPVEVKSRTDYDLLDLDAPPLGEYDPDGDSGPILWLPCGHALTRESADGIIGMDTFYTRGVDGAWSGLRPLGGFLTNKETGELSGVKTCPICRAPLSTLRRYGRALNKARLDQAELKFITAANAALSAADARLTELETDLGVTALATLESSTLRLLEQRSAAESTAADRLVTAQAAPPTLRVYSATMAALQRLRDDETGTEAVADPAVVLATLAAAAGIELNSVLHPDAGPTAGALLAASRARGGQIRVAGAKLKRAVASEAAAQRGGAANDTAAREAITKRIETLFDAAVDRCDRASHLAADTGHLLLMCRSRLAEASVVLSYASACMPLAERSVVERKRLEGIVAEAHASLSDVKSGDLGRVAAGVPGIIESVTSGLRQLAVMRRSLQDQPLTEDERTMIMAAVGLGTSGGWTSQGHVYRCPNGHVYFIGDCGGANQESTCPSCGARIGGQNHRLIEGNLVGWGP